MCWCSWSIIPQPFERWQYWICANIENKIVSVARVWSENKVWCNDLNDSGNVGLHCRFISSAANIDAKYWTAPLSNLVGKKLKLEHLAFDSAEWSVQVQKKNILWWILANSGFAEENIDEHISWNWRQCWKWVGAENIVFCSLADICYHRFYCPAITCCVFLTDAIT